MADSFLVHPIGVIATPFRILAECPRNGRQPDPAPVCRVRVFAEFVPGLNSLEGFTHLLLLYWMDHVRNVALTFVPPFDGERRGVFATRSPARPNPIGLSVVAFDGFEAPDTLLVRFLDCVDGTPLLDIKPYLCTTDAEPSAAMGWLTRHATLPNAKRPLIS
jgi:tRNA-Thr(GGU) m(6)t(6)A37 methyltransferase TsaA